MSEIFPENPLTSLPEAVAFLGALPMPVGPGPQALSPARLAEAVERGAHLYEFGGDATADEWNRLAGDDVPALAREIRRQAAEIVSLNEALTVAAEALRARQGDGCSCPLADRPHQVGCPLDGVPVDGPLPGTGPDAPEMRALRAGLSSSVDAVTRAFSPAASLREVPSGETDPGRRAAWRMLSREEPHDSPLHQTHRLGHDLPETGGLR